MKTVAKYVSLFTALTFVCSLIGALMFFITESHKLANGLFILCIISGLMSWMSFGIVDDIKHGKVEF